MFSRTFPGPPSRWVSATDCPSRLRKSPGPTFTSDNLAGSYCICKGTAATSAAPLITTGIWNVAPFFTGPGGLSIRRTDPGPAGAALDGGASEGVPGGGVGGVPAGAVLSWLTLRFVCGTLLAGPLAAAFICAMAWGAALAALFPGTVPKFAAVGASDWVTTGWI